MRDTGKVAIQKNLNDAIFILVLDFSLIKLWETRVINRRVTLFSWKGFFLTFGVEWITHLTCGRWDGVICIEIHFQPGLKDIQ